MNWFDWAKEHSANWKARESASRARAKKMFTPRALRVFGVARKEASRLRHNSIGTEHLLLGIIALNNGVAADVLKSLGLNLETVQLEIEKQGGIGPGANEFGYTPFTPRARKIIETAKKEAKTLGHACVGTEHLLLGLLQEQGGLAAHVLKKFNVELEKTRGIILEKMAPVFLPGDNEPKQELL